MPLKITTRDDGIAFDCHVQPRAKRTAIKGIRDGALAVALASPPVDGKANAALIAFLAKILGIPRRKITLIRGEHNRHKSVAITRVNAADLKEKLKPFNI